MIIRRLIFDGFTPTVCLASGFYGNRSVTLNVVQRVVHEDAMILKKTMDFYARLKAKQPPHGGLGQQVPSVSF